MRARRASAPIPCLILIAIAVAWPGKACAADTGAFYVAPDGDDAAAGTLDKPFRTPARARDAVRNGRPADAPATVYFRGGTLFLTEPLVLTPDDGGTAAAPVAYAAYRDEKPVFSVGRAVSGWEPARLNGRDVWAATVKLPADAAPVRSLWVNDRRAVRARQPNKGYLAVASVPEATDDWMKGVSSFKCAADDIKAWPGLGNGGEVVVMSRWVESRLPLKDVDEAGTLVRFAKKSVFVVEGGDRYFVEGISTLLDEPGEWWHDRAASKLYYLPRPGEEMTSARVVIPALSQVLRLEGKPQEGKYVEHVTFRGITFSHADWNHDWPGGDNARSGFNQAAVGVPEAVHCDGARECVFDGCSFAHAGTYGLALARGCQKNRVRGCTFTDLGAGGVKVGETSIRAAEAEQTFGNEITDCRITDGGHVFPSAVGVWIGQSYDNHVAHNEIAVFYYTGISVGWTWGYGQSLARGNLIEHNHVHHIGRRSDESEPILSDMGGIYTLGIQPGTVIRHNSFHDIAAIKYGGWGIYFDEGSTHITAENNLVYNTTHGGFHQHYGKENLFRNNIIAFGAAAQIQRTRLEPHQSFTFERNIVYWDEGEVLAGTWDGCNAAFDHNVYWRADGSTDFRMASMTLEQWRAKGMDVHSVVADPRFVDPAARQFGLRDDSPARKTGFAPFDLADVGPRPKVTAAKD